MTIRTHYDNLHVRSDADDATIRQAYRRLSKQYHPDLNNDPDAHRIMQLINQAYEVLSDPQKRAEHDRWIAQQRAAQQAQIVVNIATPVAPKQPAPVVVVARENPTRKRAFTALLVGLCVLLMIGVALLLSPTDAPKSSLHFAPAASQPTIGTAWLPDSASSSASSPSIMPAAASLASLNYIRPFAAPNGNPFPERAAYIDGYPVQIGQGNYRIYVENIRNSSDVFAQLFAEHGSEPLRSFFIPERSQFELPQLGAGKYLIRYQQLDGGEQLSSETIVLQGKQQEATIYLQRGRAPVTY